MQAIKRRVERQANVEALWHCKPLGPCEIMPQGAPGLLSLDAGKGDQHYMVTLIYQRGERVGYRLTKSDGGVYDVPADLSRCECKDFAYRGQYRPGGCKHLQALAAEFGECHDGTRVA